MSMLEIYRITIQNVGFFSRERPDQLIPLRGDIHEEQHLNFCYSKASAAERVAAWLNDQKIREWFGQYEYSEYPAAVGEWKCSENIDALEVVRFEKNVFANTKTILRVKLMQ